MADKFAEIISRKRDFRGEGGPVGYARTPSRVITPQGVTDIGPQEEVPPKSKVFSLPTNQNLLQKYRWDARRQRLLQDKNVQRHWKRYLELTEGAHRWDQDSWLRLNYGENDQEQLSGYTKYKGM